MDVTLRTAMTATIVALVAMAVGLVVIGETLIAGVVFLCATVAIYLRETRT